jgi:hydrogenase maturation protease
VRHSAHSTAAASDGVAPIAVIGIGNVLLGDDGFGPAVVSFLQSGWELPGTVELVDAGTPGLDLAGLLCRRRCVIFVDAVAAPAAPGTLWFYRDEELPAALSIMPRVGPHDPALAEALAISQLVGDGPSSVLFVGAVPESVDLGVNLSDAMARAVPAAAAAVLAEVARFGAIVSRREVPAMSSCLPYAAAGASHAGGV